MNNRIVTTERGWAGHYICADKCMFRRNTLVSNGSRKIVVSTIGNYYPDNWKIDTVGVGRYYETMAFESDYSDMRYYDADVSKPISLSCKWQINKIDADDEANDMHDSAVQEIIGILSE